LFGKTSPLELDSSLTLFDQNTIRQATVEHFEELVQMVPNMNLSGEGSRARYFQLRGVGEREQYEGAPNPSVGYIIDDIDLSGVGVLRGPQSARYGSSALAGIIFMRSVDPADKASADTELTAGNDGLFSIAAAAGGPLSGRLRARLSINHFESNGFRDNAYLGRDDSNGRNELTARAKLMWSFWWRLGSPVDRALHGFRQWL